ncbi:MAG: hypothetical protein COA79_11465 [Planctomycetota bacterium]|nr:MAG: hypothetical protein COA79_11465 [Planctomycetota bacterium]
MAKRQTPEDFIRELLNRSFTRDQILSRANKKDRNFYNMVFDILQHTTLIEALECQVENTNQAIINFENHSYSSKTLLNDINRLKDEKKKKTNGRSNLAIHTDIEYDDLVAPIHGYGNKVSFTTSKKRPKTKSIDPNESQLSLFDDAESKELPAFQKPNFNKEPSDISEETTILPIIEESPKPFETTCSTTNEDTSYYDGLSHKKLVSIIHKQNLRLKENNQTIRTKEDKILRSFKAADELRKKLNRKVNILKKRNWRYQFGFYIIAILFISSGITVKILDIQNTGNVIKQSLQLANPTDAASKNITITDEDTLGDYDGFHINIEDQEGTETNVPENKIADNPNQETDSDLKGNPVQIEQKELIDTPPAPEPVIHVVKRGDNWWKIAALYIGKDKAHQYVKIQKFNKLKKETLTIGQKIIIPTSAELE